MSSTPKGTARIRLTTTSQRSAACSGRQKSSKPSSPPKPVRDTTQGTPPTVVGSGRNRK